MSRTTNLRASATRKRNKEMGFFDVDAFWKEFYGDHRNYQKEAHVRKTLVSKVKIHFPTPGERATGSGARLISHH
jgi:hypothetical protein